MLERGVEIVEHGVVDTLDRPMTMRMRAVIAVFAASTCGAQQMKFVYPLPRPNAFNIVRDLPYKHSGQSTLTADLFVPANASEQQRWPVLVVFNGFGGPAMRTSPQSQAWAKAATAHGFAAVTMETTPGRVGEDFDTLVAYLNQHRDRLRVDPERVVVIAWSGNVPAGLATVEDDRRRAVKAAIVYYGWADLPRSRLDLPVLVVRAGLDQPATNRSVDRMIAAAIIANAPWTIVNYSAGHHGFDVLDDNQLSRELIERTFQFARSAISASQVSALRAGVPEASAAGALASDDFRKAVALYEPLVAAHPDDVRLLLAYANALAGAKRYKDAGVQFRRVKSLGGVGARDLGVPAARACALDHDPDEAIAWLKTIPPQFLPASLQSDPDFVSLRSRPEFQALFQQR